ncbi:hypothetical protein N9Y89_01755 [bacterium]|nr:hypothetical protein [bacterium]
MWRKRVKKRRTKHLVWEALIFSKHLGKKIGG